VPLPLKLIFYHPTGNLSFDNSDNRQAKLSLTDKINHSVVKGIKELLGTLQQ